MGDGFGWSVAMSGDRAVIGAFSNDEGGVDTGAVYVFDITTGEQLFKLRASDAQANQNFGSAVAISGDLAVVGARVFAEGGSKSVYVFDITTGLELNTLSSIDTEQIDRFGTSVAISGDRAVVGAYQDNDGGNRSGSAYVFDVNTGELLNKFVASDASGGDHFGVDVAVSGDMAVIVAPLDDDFGVNSGSAYVFDITTGNELYKINANDPGAGDMFGATVALSGNRAVFGAYLDEDFGHNSGSAYVFDIDTGTQLYKINASDARKNDFFGKAIAMTGDLAVVGSSRTNGSAYVFDLAACIADLNGDGVIDTADLGILISYFNSNTNTADEGDINGDGVVDSADLGMLITDFGQGCK